MALGSSTAKKALKGSGKRRRYKGKTVQPNGSPRSHTHGGHSQARFGYTCDDTKIAALPSKAPGLGPYRVPAPTRRHHRKGRYGSITDV